MPRVCVIGSANVDYAVTLPRLPGPEHGRLTLGVRPDAMRLRRDASANGYAATVIYTEYLGDNAYVYARLGDGTLVSVRTGPDESYEPDTPVHVEIALEGAHFFSRETGQRLSA